MSLSSVRVLFCAQEQEIRARTRSPVTDQAILLTTVESNGRNYFEKSRFTASNEITIHISHFTRKKLGHSQITKIPCTNLFDMSIFCSDEVNLISFNHLPGQKLTFWRFDESVHAF